MADALFSTRSLLRGAALQQKVREHVASIAEDALLNLPVPVSVQEVVAEVATDELDVLWDDMYTQGVQETMINLREWHYDDSVQMPGARIEVRVPFRGEPELFDVQPSSYSSSRPTARVEARRSELVLTLESQQLSTDTVRNFVDRERRSISDYVGWLNADLVTQRAEVHQFALEELSARRERLLHARGIESALGIPIRPAGAASTYPLPVRPTRLRLTESASREKYQPEPELELSLYEDIVRLVRNFRSTLERSPKTFSKLSEEELRDHLLLILNANYSGAALAEVFNGNGKTDILLRHNDRNVFIAECKFWRGAASFTAAIDQLLGYLVWRDSKAALILFIRNRDVSQVIAKAAEALRSHPRYVSGGAGVDPTDRSDFILRAEEEGTTKTIRTALIPIVVPSAEPEH